MSRCLKFSRSKVDGAWRREQRQHQCVGRSTDGITED